jgi:hypothetical protein
MLKGRGFRDSPLEAILVGALAFSKAISRGTRGHRVSITMVSTLSVISSSCVSRISSRAINRPHAREHPTTL